MRSFTHLALATAVLFGTTAHADSGASATIDLSTLTVDGVVELLDTWGLDTAFSQAFRNNKVSGSDLATYFKRGRVDAKTFAPNAQPFQWDKLWDHIERLAPPAEQAHTGEASKAVNRPSRRRLAATSTPSGVQILSDNARVSFGPSNDAYIQRTDDGVLTVNGTLTELQADGSSLPYVNPNTLQDMVMSMVQEAVGTRACTYGKTGTYCNETCTDVSYYAIPGCFYHDNPGEDALQLQDAAAFVGWYRPDLEAATVQCCSATSCTRKIPNSNNCLAGTRSASSPFDVYVDWQTANDTCTSYGMRLCSIDEYLELGHDCCGSGCSYDLAVVWTSDMQYNCGGLSTY